jgi:3-oxoacyl-[acyl-carrier protein] reductase
MQRLAGRVAVVTGAAEGIGRAVAVGLASEGAAVVLADDREDRLHEVHAELGQRAYKSVAIPTDVTDELSVSRLIKQSLSVFPRIDILVNGASLRVRASIEDTTEELWDKVLQSNLLGAFLCSKAVVPGMLRQSYGRIISFTSAEAFNGSRDAAPYAAAKAGIIGFSKALALEMAPYGITVNTICADEHRDESSESPAGTDAGIGPAIFLASDAAAYVTGQTVFVNDAPLRE